MAWIESHQSVVDHPKTRKLARRLNISIPTAVGHLHCLWLWALDYADDGDLDRYEDEDVALAARWDGDVIPFVQALIDSGWVDQDRAIHDWWEYAGKLVDRRRADAERKRTSRGQRTDGARTQHNTTDTTQPNPKPSADDAGFASFWEQYPPRNGKKVEKRRALEQWWKLDDGQRDQVMVGVKHYANACNGGLTLAKDAFRWLRDELWNDWQTPARASPNRSKDRYADMAQRLGVLGGGEDERQGFAGNGHHEAGRSLPAGERT